MNFKIGDVVKLNSGGPYMTIIGIENEFAKCQWFEGVSIKESRFLLQAIFKPKPPSYGVAIA